MITVIFIATPLKNMGVTQLGYVGMNMRFHEIPHCFRKTYPFMFQTTDQTIFKLCEAYSTSKLPDFTVSFTK